MTRRLVWLASSLFTLAITVGSCAEDAGTAEPDPGSTVDVSDAASADVQMTHDAPADVAGPDPGIGEDAAVDPGVVDPGAADSGPADALEPDPAPADSGPADAPEPDLPPADSGPADALEPDLAPADSDFWIQRAEVAARRKARPPMPPRRAQWFAGRVSDRHSKGTGSVYRMRGFKKGMHLDAGNVHLLGPPPP